MNSFCIFSSVIYCFLVVHFAVGTLRISGLCQIKRSLPRHIYKVMSPRLVLCKLLPMALCAMHMHACKAWSNINLYFLLNTKTPIETHGDDAEIHYWEVGLLIYQYSLDTLQRCKRFVLFFNYLNGIKTVIFPHISIYVSLCSNWFQQLNNIWYVAQSHYGIKLIFGRGQCTGLAQLSPRVGPVLQLFILTWHGLNCDQGSSRSRSKPFHCSLARLTSAITRNMLVTRVCNFFVGGLRSRHPMNISNMQQTAGVTHKWPRVFNPSRLLDLLKPKKTKQKREKGKNEACQHGPCARMTRKC